MMMHRRPSPLAPVVDRTREGAVERLFELSFDLLGTADSDGYFTALNPAWERTLGFSREELMSRPFIDFVHPEDRELTSAEAERLVRTEAAAVDFDNRYAVKAGGWRRLSWRTTVSGGQLYFVARDITDRVQAERQRMLLGAVAEDSTEPIFTKTPDGVISSWNRGAERLYGYSATEAVGRRASELLGIDGRDLVPEGIMRRLLAGGSIGRRPVEVRTKAGNSLRLVLSASLVRDPSDAVLGAAVVARHPAPPAPDAGPPVENTALRALSLLRRGLDEGRVIFHAQPIVGLNGEGRGHELLCRMLDEEGGLVAPGEFLPVAETSGMIEEVDLLAFDEAARQAARGHRVSINVSAATIARPDITARMARSLAAAGADPGLLTVELTETALMADIAAGQRFSDRIASLGCRLSLDDFGTGFGGFTYLKRLQIRQLKIDREFVCDLTRSRASQYLVKAVVALAHDFGLETVAEGVEDQETFDLLREYGVDSAQGYLIARPRPVSEVMAAG